jgi:hypothetical protein
MTAAPRRPAAESPWKSEEITAVEGPEELDAVAEEDVEDEPELEDLADEEDEVELPVEPGAAAEEEDDSEW